MLWSLGTLQGGGSGGQNSAGNYAAEHILPSGKIISITTLDQRRMDGLPWEPIAVPPDIRTVQTEADIKQGRDLQIEYAFELLS
jgi:hypothetical protein